MAAKVKDNNMINESYREIRTYLTINDEMKTILVTSAEMNEGKTTTICNLAKCFGELDDIKVILIDCDFKKRGVSRKLGIGNPFGVSDIVFGNKKLDECIQKVEDIDVLPSGGVPNNTSMLLNSKVMKNLVNELREKYDYVFIDSPPICRLNDACIIAQYVDGTVLVNASKEIDSKVAKLTLEKLKKVGANVIGVVLNKFRSEQYNYYSYYSYYGYDDNRKGIFRRKKKKKKHR
ncbi:MAG: CpsD/CapB family tyrosine-protein kinase [Intestinibacter bartlettii]|mgnify:FL=1|uniref:CpsD/CapB family tyrosine-protein kinase n=1 Tax=Intestinibacter bartlettii TaxID=261299 RepID=UPI00290F676B|nr:CpsD/CapB family tyrosine-protein kinase [Intestinibacter bartlettii]MDU6198509.1 CpsD/CapB family tyrosine-protein kinase [Intestinibacter bartlettii]